MEHIKNYYHDTRSSLTATSNVNQDDSNEGDHAAPTAADSRFFEFYSSARALLDLLDSYSGEVDPISVNNERKLLEAVFFLIQRDLLVELPLA